jgi:hypothetical protein
MSSGGITINYDTPNITHTSGLPFTRQFFTVFITITQLSLSGKLTVSLSGTDLLWNWLGILPESRYIASAPTSQKIWPLLFERVYRIIA